MWFFRCFFDMFQATSDLEDRTKEAHDTLGPPGFKKSKKTCFWVPKSFFWDKNDEFLGFFFMVVGALGWWFVGLRTCL